MYNFKQQFHVHFRMGKLILIATFMLAFSLKSYSQSPNKNETIDYLNRMLGSQTQVELKGNNLLIISRNEKGEIIKEDKAPISELQTNAVYEKETDLLCIPCLKDAEGCVMRTLIVQKVKRPYERMSIIAGGETKFKSLQKAFDHLIRLQSEIGYKDEVSFE